jgi:hypothetical protein
MTAATSEPTMGEKDILDELLEGIKANGTLDRSDRDRLMLMAFAEMIRRIRRVEHDSIAGVFKRNPAKAIAVVVITFVLLHEFSTYVNIGVIVAAALKALGVPIG